MTAFVLVHGAWHGGWCWRRVVDRLDAAGQRALAPDLPSHGEDRTPPAGVTLDAYVERVCACIDEAGSAGEPVVLVGHSMGGVVISQAAEARSEALAGLVYLAAMLPEADGRLEDTSVSPELSRRLSLAPDRGSILFDPAGAAEIFYGDCCEEDRAFAIERLCSQPAAVSRAKLRLSREHFGAVPRFYIECLRDAALPLAQQRAMHSAQPCREVYRLDSSHSPFFSMPGALTDVLLDVAERLRPAEG